MQNFKIHNTIQKTLLFFGDRLAFILFFIFVLVLLASGRATQVLSKQDESHTIRQKNNWYQETKSPVKHDEAFTVTHRFLTAKISPAPIPAIVIRSDSNDVWEKLAQCETHGNWSSDTGNGYYGGLQFNMSAWIGTGGTGSPAQASRDEQIIRGKILQEKRGWSPWGGCSRKLGLL